MSNKILIIAICGLFGSMNVMTAYAQGAQGQIAPKTQLPNLVGLLANTDHLEKLGIFSIDNITAAASLYALQDMSQTPGAKAHLSSGFFEYFQRR